MDNNERKEVFGSLVAILRQNRLDWIVDQVTEQIHIGRTVFKEVDTLKRPKGTEVASFSLDSDAVIPDLRRGPKAQFPTTVEYNDKEKLTLLLDGIVQAINALEMESKVFEEIAVRRLRGLSEISFYSEESGATATVISPGRVPPAGPQLSGIRDLINKLREEASED